MMEQLACSCGKQFKYGIACSIHMLRLHNRQQRPVNTQRGGCAGARAAAGGGLREPATGAGRAANQGQRGSRGKQDHPRAEGEPHAPAAEREAKGEKPGRSSLSTMQAAMAAAYALLVMHNPDETSPSTPQSLVEKELVKGIGEESHLLQLEIGALRKEAAERSRVRAVCCCPPACFGFSVAAQLHLCCDGCTDGG